MSLAPHAETVPPPTHLPVWLASVQIQLGSCLLVLGVGVLAISIADGSQSLVVGTVLAASGYAAVGSPGWYVTRAPSHRRTVRRVAARLWAARP